MNPIHERCTRGCSPSPVAPARWKTVAGAGIGTYRCPICARTWRAWYGEGLT